MSRLEVAVGAKSDISLPALLIAGYVEKTAALSPLTKVFTNATSLTGGHSILLSLDNGNVAVDEEVLRCLEGCVEIEDQMQRALVSVSLKNIGVGIANIGA